MMLRSILVLLVGVQTAVAQASDYRHSEEYNTISSVEITDVTQIEFALQQPQNSKTTFGGVLDEAEVILDQIIRMGDKVWKIIEKNKPVVTQNYQSASAVPQGITDWRQLQGWSAPQVRVYRMVYKNVYGMEVVSFSYRVAFAHGGNMNGKGLYITSAMVEPSTVDVLWGYTFNASGQVLNVTNAGTSENPVAAIEIRLDWSVDTVIKHMQSSTRFYLRGDGLFANLSNGNQPALLK